jgi:hypothetical protein
MTRQDIGALTYRKAPQGHDLLCLADGSPYTGLVYEALANGYVTTEYEVKNGLKDGVEQEFYAADHVAHVAHYWQGLLHGEVRYYYPEGGVREKSVFAYGICLEEFEWDETGALTHHQVLDLPAYQHVLLQHYRREFGQ